jgi:hypothetical protein
MKKLILLVAMLFVASVAYAQAVDTITNQITSGAGTDVVVTPNNFIANLADCTTGIISNEPFKITITNSAPTPIDIFVNEKTGLGLPDPHLSETITYLGKAMVYGADPGFVVAVSPLIVTGVPQKLGTAGLPAEKYQMDLNTTHTIAVSAPGLVGGVYGWQTDVTAVGP